jgi:hypothetical protein
MTTVIQFIVLKRGDKWVVKSRDLERAFSAQRDAVLAAIRFANYSGKEGKPGGGAVRNRKLKSRRFGDTGRAFILRWNQIYP